MKLFRTKALVLIPIFAILVLVPVVVSAQGTSPPHGIAGDAVLNGRPAPIGTLVEAMFENRVIDDDAVRGQSHWWSSL